MNIHWNDLAAVFGVSLGIVVLVVVMFSLGVAARARFEASRDLAPIAAPGGHHGRPDRMAQVAALLCFGACAAVAGYGIYLIVPQFH